MLAAHHRLHRSDDFRRTMRRGSRSSGPTLMLHLLRPTESSETTSTNGAAGPPARVGLVVSRAVGGAVVRNQVARRLRHLVHERLDQLEPGTLLVLRAHPRAAGASSAALGDDLDACLGVLRGRGSSASTRRNSR